MYIFKMIFFTAYIQRSDYNRDTKSIGKTY